MSDFKFDSQERRKVISALQQEGPMSHDNLAQELGYDWNKTQEMIRELRKDGLVAITLDRRYRVKEVNTSLTA